MPTLHRSRVLDKLRSGECVFTYKINLESSRAVEIAAMCGMDCVWCCDEHVSNDWSLTERQILAAKAEGIDLMMRVQRGSYSDLIKPLELDASGIMVPHVMSGADAAEIARRTRFAPVGRRPVDGGNADGRYAMLPAKEYFDFVNHNRFVVVQIEDFEALQELDAICATPGIDIILFGCADFSQSIGQNGNYQHPEVSKARKQVAETALRHGKIAGVTSPAQDIPAMIDMGFRFICCGADVFALAEDCRRIVACAKNAVAERKPNNP